jgi:cytochrome c553
MAVRRLAEVQPGPQLASVHRKKSLSWLIRFIRNSQQVIDSGDSYAAALFDRYNRQVMPSFESLTDQEIRSILYYVAIESRTPVETITSDQEVMRSGNASLLRGKQLFQQQCASCHAVHFEGDQGPALGSIAKRHSRDWLFSFIRNSQRVVQQGDPYATRLFYEYDEQVMVPMPFLTDNEIESVLAYVTFVSSSPSSMSGANGRTVPVTSYPTATAGPSVTTAPDREQQGQFGRVTLIVLTIATGVGCSMLVARLFGYLRNDNR